MFPRKTRSERVAWRALVTSSVLLLASIYAGRIVAQETHRGRNIFFPTPMYDRDWLASFGFITTATPMALTEDFQFRIPAGDVQVLRQLHGGLHLNSRLQVQILQNHLSIGPRWAKQLDDHWNFSLGTDVGWFKGVLDLEGYDTEARGWDALPNISIGLRTGRNVGLTLKTEAILNLQYSSRVGDQEIERPISRYNGMAWSLYLEQPFFGRTHISLGFTARLTNYYWATWALFDLNEKKHLYRQITVAFIP